MLVIYVDLCHRRRHISLLKDLLGARFRAVQSLLLRFAREDRDLELYRELDVFRADRARHDVGLFAFDHRLETFDDARRVDEDLGQAEVVREFVHVLGDHKLHAVFVAELISPLISKIFM